MKKFEFIIQAGCSEEQERKIAAVAHIKYRLPAISSYVVELDPKHLPYLQNIEGVQAIHADSLVSFGIDKADALLYNH